MRYTTDSRIVNIAWEVYKQACIGYKPLPISFTNI